MLFVVRVIAKRTLREFWNRYRFVFNIRGNRFRLVAWINYRWRVVYVKWVGTHAEYDRIDVEQVGL